MKNTQKFASLAGKLNIGVMVFIVVTGISILVCIILPLLSVINPSLFMDDKGLVSGTFEFSELKIKLSNAPISFTSIQNFLFLIGLFGAFSMALVLYMEKQIYNVLSCVKKEKPFDALCIKSIKVLGFCILGASFLLDFTKNLSVYLMYSMFELDTVVITSPLFKGSFEGYSLSFPINFSLLGVGIIVLFLSYVFEYGAHLQSEYDATL